MSSFTASNWRSPGSLGLLVVFLAVVIGVGGAIGIVTAPREWYAALRKPPFNPPGYDPAVIKPWAPNFEQYVSLREKWIEEWNKTYGYRQ